ncbi:AAA family ATPase [Bacillus sp. B15-48]|uniref:Lon protease family protein n=1 Tax=Bacillus sp. B15-48 TaxID=1548601 RepID=UPI00193F6720|nr:AAA family ATPase [Bacillus sp. B15-48]MBM4761477.1 AAA family ATPase [Bacillus sp. B15-48]
MNREKFRVPVSKLMSSFDPAHFPFETTADLDQQPNEMIGQQRAEQAMEFGLSVEQTGYNLFIVGPSGTGRMTYTLDSVANIAKTRSVPDDWCYVYNFENPDRPTAISLPAGEGIRFQQKIETLLIEIERELRTAFSGKNFEANKQKILEAFRDQIEDLWGTTEAFALEKNFRLERTPAGVNTYPLRMGRPLDRKEFAKLTEFEQEMIQQREKQVEEKIRETIFQMREKEEELRKTVEQFMRQTVVEAIEGLFQPLRETYKHHEKVITYLEAYFHDIVLHFSFFLAEEDEENNVMAALTGTTEQRLQRYTVHLFVNHKNESGAPVIYETNPTFYNLFGKVEYKGSFGAWTTDFTHIKPGALHLANGGYLIVQATELLQQPYAWTLLKRSLQTGYVQIENLNEERGMVPTSGIKPEPLPLNLKIIIIGSYYLYDLLSSIDEDFHKLFKVKVEFNTVMEKTNENSLLMARFVKNYSDKEGLLPFHRRAVAKVIDYSSRLVDEQTKLSTRFQDIVKVLVESSYWAQKQDNTFVDDTHIEQAIAEQIHRSNHVSELYRERIEKGIIMVDTDGYRVGQINGLAVMGTRDSSFGIPTKITAQTYVGKTGIMNIEREAALSGQIHNKGHMILIGYLSGQFAKNYAIPLSASIAFEQTYSYIDGDSASSTELYVLLSSLAEVPIYQGIAVTGSVNQWGEIQPIGGVNEKIEGFFHICQQKGLTGKQGVLIPKQNVANLMLAADVVEAVSRGDFHIWAVCDVTEGIEILTGVPAGSVRDDDGAYPEGSIFAKVEARFSQMYEVAKARNQQEQPAKEEAVRD